jgi:hypothetical protein
LNKENVNAKSHIVAAPNALTRLTQDDILAAIQRHQAVIGVVESSAQVSPLSPADRDDLEYAMKCMRLTNHAVKYQMASASIKN